MPQATVSVLTERYDLRSCPGGFVDLKRMTYGQFLERRDMASKMTMETSDGRRGDRQAELVTMQRRVAAFEFRHCIVDHNLEDENGAPLDFRQPIILERLDPRVGQEIGEYIDQMNQFEEEIKD
jgi:hypothetical protein